MLLSRRDAVNGTMSSNMNPATGASDLRERSFQNVVETVLRPSGIKVGGFPEEMFLDLDENDKERLICNIWYATSELLVFSGYILYRVPQSILLCKTSNTN